MSINLQDQIKSLAISKVTSNLGRRKRLRKKFMNSQERSFADYEILEMILYLAKPRGDTKKIAKEMLHVFGDLISILNAEVIQLKKITGIGDSTIFTFKLLSEFFSRLHIPLNSKRFNVLSNFSAVINYCNLTMGYKTKEYFRILYLNKKNVLLEDNINEEGTIDQIQIYPREIAKKVLEINASAIILVHNHPSGDASPSKEDIDITKILKQTLATFNVTIHDHIIVSKGSHYSFKNNGLL